MWVLLYGRLAYRMQGCSTCHAQQGLTLPPVLPVHTANTQSLLGALKCAQNRHKARGREAARSK